MRHFKIAFRPDGKQIAIHSGATIFEAAGLAGIVLNGTCGGKGICKSCKVIIEPDGEQVLACQYRIQSDLTVTIPVESRFFESRILAEGIDVQAGIELDEEQETAAAAGRVLGLAVDIGTTTVVAKIVDFKDAAIMATEAALNPQSRYGDDVVSRIAYADSEEKLAQLHSCIIDCVNRLIGRLCGKAAVDPKRIRSCCVVGNTTMSHLFLKFPVTSLGQAPYKPYSLDAQDVPAGRLGLAINPDANVHTVENIASFVGSDITAAAVATGMDTADELTLLVDIGTNGEVVLGTKEKLYAASCAAGPAFEGAGISCGSRAVEGAIEAVVFEDMDLDFDVIGNGPARSICGSGLIDAVALLLELGVIEQSGRFIDPSGLRGSIFESIVSRVIDYKGKTAFCLADTRDSDGRLVVLTQEDIRQTQLAKAAIQAGIRFLQKQIGAGNEDIEKILLAGAFGNYIRPRSALSIGLLPDVPAERIHFVGNAAASGAQLILLSKKARQRAEKLARRIEYIEIAKEKDFTDVFAEAMSF